MEKKRKALRFGHLSESLACWFLRFKGYRVVKRNLRLPMGEIDIIAIHGNTLCFIEVKARETHASALHALSPHQQKRIIRAAKSFLSHNQRYCNHEIRFDLIAITKKKWPIHIQNAWTEN
jgi:putative endonuclease